jgi:hypothetical protein
MVSVVGLTPTSSGNPSVASAQGLVQPCISKLLMPPYLSVEREKTNFQNRTTTILILIPCGLQSNTVLLCCNSVLRKMFEKSTILCKKPDSFCTKTSLNRNSFLELQTPCNWNDGGEVAREPHF